MGKEKLLAPKFDSFCKHDGWKKITPPCSMFLKASFIGLTFFNMLKMNCFMLPIMGQICWTRSCPVWHMMAQTKWFRSPQCVLTTPKRKAHKWIWWERERLVIIVLKGGKAHGRRQFINEKSPMLPPLSTNILYHRMECNEIHHKGLFCYRHAPILLLLQSWTKVLENGI